MKTLFCYFFLLLCLEIKQVHAQTLHLIIANNQKENSNTINLQHELRPTDYLYFHAQQIADENYSNFNFHQIIVNPNKLEDTFAEIKFSEKDIILFYYSGHGLINNEGMSSQVFIKKNSIVPLYEVLKKQKAQLKIMLADGKIYEKQYDYNRYIMPQYNLRHNPIVRQLFAYSKGAILINTSEVPNYAIKNLIYLFFDSISSVHSSPSPPSNWKFLVLDLQRKYPYLTITNEIKEEEWIQNSPQPLRQYLHHYEKD